MLLGFQSGDRAAQSAGSALLGGPFTSAFWSLVVVAGLLVPLAMEVVELRQHRRLSAMTPVLILLGGLSLRWVLLLAGQASSFRGI